MANGTDERTAILDLARLTQNQMAFPWYNEPLLKRTINSHKQLGMNSCRT